ncbi:WYL domain-containing protein [Salegentibacter sp. F188]|uniref:WYL domain-containing protein n=1 Tax=Autumnicola patrickiae TaxID=3075591 RepID=A0ABU3DYD8_9FLAO|nr:WYL domain-containing protein [Salegentibacter sp. F188]MDT0688731.1 WYL domain-containing protein [Salegentibacter sp. F188]
MSVRQTIKRHYKIISLLKKRPMSYEELSDEILSDPDSLEENLLKSQRTLQRDIKDIASIYGIEIASDRAYNKYFIVDDFEMNHSQRLRENFEILNAIRLSRSLGSSLIFEKRKSLGTEHMAGLLHAIQNLNLVKFQYYKFREDSQSTRKVKPISLKEARNRWYLIAMDTKDEQIKNFSLDRIQELSITSEKFKKIEYNIHEEFKDSFGIINGTDEEPVKVVLAFTAREGKYVASLPLHQSQQLNSEDEKEMCFSYFIRPTYDFRMEILSYGDQVKVMEPKELGDKIAAQLTNALESYYSSGSTT